jgi:Tfp pilus assembly protein PilF
LLLFLLAAAGSASLGDSLRTKAKFEQRLPLPPNADAIQRWGAGLAAPAAAAYWLQYLSTIGGWIVDEEILSSDQLRDNLFGHEERGVWATHYLENIIKLAPHFPDPYLYGGIMFYWYGSDVSLARKFLEKGYAANIQKWEIPFYLGIYAYRNHEYEKAVDWLKNASLFPDVPAIVPLTATMVAAKMGQPEAGLVLLDSLLMQLPPKMEPFRALIERDREVQRQLFEINSALARFHARFGAYPQRLEELADAALLDQSQLDVTANGVLQYQDGKVTFDAEL